MADLETFELHRALVDLMDRAVRIHGPGCTVWLALRSRSSDDDRRWSCQVSDPVSEEVAAAFRVSAENAVTAVIEQLEQGRRLEVDGEEE